METIRFFLFMGGGVGLISAGLPLLVLASGRTRFGGDLYEEGASRDRWLLSVQIAVLLLAVLLFPAVLLLRQLPEFPVWVSTMASIEAIVAGGLANLALPDLPRSHTSSTASSARRMDGWGYAFNATDVSIALPDDDVIEPGALYGEGTVIADPLPEGIGLLELATRHDPTTERWDPETHSIVARNFSEGPLPLGDAYLLEASDRRIGLRATSGNIEPISPRLARELEELLWPVLGILAIELAATIVQDSRSLATDSVAMTYSGFAEN
jgi:hypothetical protein